MTSAQTILVATDLSSPARHAGGKRLHELAFAAGLTAVEYSAGIVHGDPAQQIVAMEQEFDADLIVVGKHGSHIAEELLLGSVTKHALTESQCDVLVICDPRQASGQSL